MLFKNIWRYISRQITKYFITKYNKTNSKRFKVKAKITKRTPKTGDSKVVDTIKII